MSKFDDFLRGFMCAFDGFDSFESEYPYKSEMNAIGADFKTVGDDIRQVMQDNATFAHGPCCEAKR